MRVGHVEVVDSLPVLHEVAGAFDRPAVTRERAFESLIEIVRTARVTPPLHVSFWASRWSGHHDGCLVPVVESGRAMVAT